MKQYQFKDVLFMSKEKVLSVENEEKECVGFIKKADIPGCEKGHTFSFTSQDGTIVSMGIKKRRIKNFLTATYFIETEGMSYELKDKAGDSLLYFCVVGELDGKEIRIEESWSEEIKVKINREHMATLKPSSFSLKTTIDIDEDFNESTPFFAVTVMMYFMYKIYKEETEFIENLLTD